MVTLARVKKLIHYDPRAGAFTWRIDRGNRYKAGSLAGGLRPDGYWQIGFDGERILGHRLAWFYMTGAWPVGVDHINRNKYDNRWCNLRAANQAQNLCNTRSHRDSTSAIKGVSLNTRTGKWIAQIMVRGKYTHLGYFETEAAAGKARRQVEEELQGDYRLKETDVPAGRIRSALHDPR